MKQIQLDHMVKDHTYYIQRGNKKFKAVYDGYVNCKYNFKKIIRLNTPTNWCGYIGFFEHLNYTVYESQKNKGPISNGDTCNQHNINGHNWYTNILIILTF